MSDAILARENAQLIHENQQLREANISLQQSLDWFKRQIFGEKSEKRHEIDFTHQADLLADVISVLPPPPVAQKASKQARHRKVRSAETVTDTGLRFDASVPVREIELPCPEIKGLDPSAFERIGEKVTYRLAQLPASYEVLKYVRPVVKLKAEQKIVTAPNAPQVLDRSVADVSFLVGLLLDKFQYHLPLYRQHQRLGQAGITVSRFTLTQLTRRAIDLLQPIYDAQFRHVLQSRVLALDETPIKAGREKGRKGKLKQSYFWPIYGENDEIVFPFTLTKGFDSLQPLLEDWQPGTMLSDGASVYTQYAKKIEALTHANCWAHSRREFERAQGSNPQESADALSWIGELYRHERIIREQSLEGDAKLEYRVANSVPVVNGFWGWCEAQSKHAWTSVDKIGAALEYVRNRRAGLEVFLSDPEVAIDTNHLERSLRPIPMGRRSWLFCWTELGAKHVGIIQSLLVTCRLHGVHPYTYLVDVLQRVDQHPAQRVEELTPRVWKTKFADNPLKSMLDRIPQ